MMRKECDKKENMRYKCRSYKANERRNEEEKVFLLTDECFKLHDKFQYPDIFHG